MNRHAGSNAHSRRTQSQGFTIIELMVVVTITAILAAIAIPTFTGYIYKSRTSEATTFLGEIKLREEAFRSEFGRYRADSDSFPNYNFVPALTSLSGGSTVPWPGDPVFDDIGARPDSQVRFGFAILGGLPASAPQGAPPGGLGFTAATADHWFAAQAQADLDGDGDFCTFELTSHTRTVWFNPAKGWE